MIIVDFNRVVISNFAMLMKGQPTAPVEMNMVRHMVLDSIRSINHKFSHQYGELVIACDGKNYWRKSVYPYYKANRKKATEDSKFDWSSIRSCLDQMREEIMEYLPYRLIQIDQAEADDIVGTLVREHGEQININPILIVSEDHDFVQLQKWANVVQYAPSSKKWLTEPSPDDYLIEHTIRGDTGDGIPNILSQDDCFVLGVRQTKMTKGRFAELFDNAKNGTLDPIHQKNWERNARLIDLSYTPSDIQKQIIAIYNEQQGRNRSKLVEYFMKYRLRNLTEHIAEF